MGETPQGGVKSGFDTVKVLMALLKPGPEARTTELVCEGPSPLAA